MIKLILVRHGQSVWNLLNKFTGWTDVGLSQQGVVEARRAGELIVENDIKINMAFCSVLNRAEHTLQLIAEKLNYKVPVYKSWKLNERHYGALQGLNKQQTIEKYGSEQVKKWRRSYETQPPLLSIDDKRNPKFDELYSYVKEDLPLGESLKDTAKRVVEYYNKFIKTKVKDGQNALIVAHGNSLRALIQYLDNMSNVDVENLEVPTGKPIVYELDDNLKVIKHYYL